MRQLITKLLIGVMALTLIGVPAMAAEFTIKAGHGAQAGHPTHFGLLQLAKVVQERSNGRLEIKVFPDRQLGEERELVEGLQFGTVDMTVVSTGPLGGFVGEINVLDLPFLFKNRSHAYSVFDGPIGNDLMAKFDPIGIEAVAVWENGWRHLTTKKPVNSPADLKGLKMRTMANQIHMAAFKALGAGPVPMAWGEVYTSLDQGVIEAQENPITVIYTNSLWEVQNYVTLTGHVYGPHMVLISKKSLAKLPQDLQQILIKAAKETSSFQRQVSMKLEAEQTLLLEQKGMKINTVDLAPFSQQSRSAYKLFTDKYGEAMLTRITTAGGEN